MNMKLKKKRKKGKDKKKLNTFKKDSSLKCLKTENNGSEHIYVWVFL